MNPHPGNSIQDSTSADLLIAKLACFSQHLLLLTPNSPSSSIHSSAVHTCSSSWPRKRAVSASRRSTVVAASCTKGRPTSVTLAGVTSRSESREKRYELALPRRVAIPSSSTMDTRIAGYYHNKRPGRRSSPD